MARPSDLTTLNDTGVISVLLVEDDPADAYIFKRKLFDSASSPFHYEVVEQLGAALNLLAVAEPDLIVLDLSLPDADGLEGLMAVTEIAPDLPIVILTGLYDQALTLKALRMGAQDYLRKDTYDAALLHRTIRYALERQQLLTQLRYGEARLKTIVDHTADGLIILNREQEVLFINPAAERLLHTSAHALMGAPLGFPVPDDGNKVEWEVYDPSHPLTLEVTAVDILWDNLEAQLLCLNDITGHKSLGERLRKAKEEAEALATMKTSLLTSMNHEIRTPLSGIIGFADALLSEDLTDAEREDFARIIKNGGVQLLQTINSVLDHARLEAAAVDLNTQPVSIPEIIQHVTTLLTPLAEQKGLYLRADINTPLGVIMGDPPYLNRILENLIGNALKFTIEGGITVRLSREAQELVLAVEDTGIGISDKFLPHVFEEFRQEQGGIARPYQGTGLGLSITRRLVELMGGQIAVQSAKGHGSTFTVRFPMSAHPPSLPAPSLPAPALNTLIPATPRLLVVDDQPEMQLLVEQMIKNHFDLTVVGSIAAALEAAAASCFDAFLFDLHLQNDETGIDLIQKLRHYPMHTHTPALAMTAYDVLDDRLTTLKSAGFRQCLSKPFSRKQLLESLEAILI